MKFHERLKAYRSNLNVKQKEVAKRLNVHPSLISRYESGARTIVIDRLAEIQKAYNIPDEHFFDMLISSDPKTTRMQPQQAKELQSHYNDSLYNDHKDLLYSDRFRYLFTALTALPDELRVEFIKKMTKEIDRIPTAYETKDDD